MKKRKAGSSLRAESGTTSASHEAQPATASGFNHHQAVSEVTANPVGDDREVSGGGNTSVFGGSVSVTTSAVPIESKLNRVTWTLRKGYPAVTGLPGEVGRPPHRQNRPLPRAQPGHTRVLLPRTRRVEGRPWRPSGLC